MDAILAALLVLVGGMAGGLVGVGGGVIFVPALTIFLGYSQVEAESTSLLMIVLVALVGTMRQRRHGNVDLRTAAIVAILSPLGVLVGVVVANSVPHRALELAFAAFVLVVAAGLLRRSLFSPR